MGALPQSVLVVRTWGSDAARDLRTPRRAPAGGGRARQRAAGQPVSRPAVSQHPKVLNEAGLVLDRPAGNRRIYQVDPDGRGALRAQLDGLDRADARRARAPQPGPPRRRLVGRVWRGRLRGRLAALPAEVRHAPEKLIACRARPRGQASTCRSLRRRIQAQLLEAVERILDAPYRGDAFLVEVKK